MATHKNTSDHQTGGKRNSLNLDGKQIAVISYLTVIGFLIAFVFNHEKQDPFAGYHIKQSLALIIISALLLIIAQIPFVGWIISIPASIILFVIWIIGLMNAIHGEKKPVPGIGKYAAEKLKNL